MNPIKLLLIILISLSITSCKKDLTDGKYSGTTDYVLTINGKDLSKNKSSLDKNKAANSSEQTIITQLDENTNVIATLIALDNNINNQEISKKAATTTNRDTVSNELADNTKIKILVYASNGELFKMIDHIYKQSHNTEIIVENLKRGETYTFIAYSINSIETVPTATDISTLSELKIDGLTSDLLYFKQSIRIEEGTGNHLNIKLKHQFSSVYMSLAIDQSATLNGSRISQITDPTISPAFTSAQFDLNTGTPTFTGELATGKSLEIKNVQLSDTTIVSETSRILADGSPSTFNINSLTINGFTQSINLSGFNIEPGVRYHLKLSIACPCTMDVIPTRDISIANYEGTLGNTKTQPQIDYDNADFGAVLDIYKIDNSLNLSVNGTPIYKGSATVTEGTVDNFSYPENEIQFQGYGRFRDVSSPPNIEFEDGTRWGVNIIPERSPVEYNEIWKFDGFTNKKPIIKITIDNAGNVNMFASKNTIGGPPFYPIKAINNKTVRTNNINGNYLPTIGTYISYNITGAFQKVIWNNKPEQINTIILGQRESGATSFEGRITGKKIVPCTPIP